MSSLEPSKKSLGLVWIEPQLFSSNPILISSVVPPSIDYIGSNYDVYNYYMCNNIECGYGFITSYCYVRYFIREECQTGAVDVCPKCGKCLEQSKYKPGLPSLEPSKKPSKFSTY